MQGSAVFFSHTADPSVVIADIKKILPRDYYLTVNETGDEDLRQVWSKKSQTPVKLRPALREKISRIKGVENIVP